MRSSPTAHRTRLRQAAFTLVEMSVAMAIAVAVSLTAYNALRSGLLLSSQNLGINVSAQRGRTIIDQIGTRARYAIDQPALINSDGTLSTASTADGILIKRLIGNPYVVKDAAGGTSDIAATANQFVVEYRTSLQPPQVGDWILIESVTRPRLEISAVSVVAATTAVQRRLITTATAVGELLQPSDYRLAGQLFRQEAYLFVNTETGTNPHAALRHYERVRASTVFATPANYQIMASDYRRLNGQAYFANSTTNNYTTATVQAVCNSSIKQEKVARTNTASAYTSVPVQLRLWSVNH